MCVRATSRWKCRVSSQWKSTINNLEDEARTDFTRLDETLWQSVPDARAGALFETPIVHFIVRAFLADGMDEVMAHMTAIEAGLGLEMDHRRGLRPKPDAHRNVSASDRAAARLAALLNDANAATAYRELFELRSSYVHGRAGLAKIPTPLRLNARRLARKMAEALVAQSPVEPATRVQVLGDLLDRGAPLL